MKLVSCVTKAVLTTGLAGLVFLFAPRAQSAGFSITPSSITNDFQGTIALNITGLAAGETVTVEQYLDANGNGVIDAGQESLVRSFMVTDGRVLSIGGVRYLGVPGDEDGLTNGQIRVELLYPGGNETLSRIAANYLFRIYDPVVGFTPVTNSFSIAQKVYPQAATGKVTAAGTGTPLTNAVVVMVTQDGPGSGAVADAGGNFTIYGPPGDYLLVAIQNGFVDDQSGGGVTLSSNAVTTQNLTNLVATRTLTGKVSDSGSGLGLAGIFVQAETSGNLFSLAFSDASGNFTLPATAETWKVKVDGESGVAELGYLAANSSITTNVTSGSASNLNLQFSKANAMVFGSVKDNQSNAVANLPIQGNDFSYTFEAKAQTDVNGNYAIGLFAADWNIGPDNRALAALGLIGQGADLTVTNGQALRQDFTVQRAGTHLRGRVIDDTGTPLDNMELVVQIFNGPGPGSTSVYPSTLGDGSFDAAVSAGHWNIALECSSAGDRGVVSPSLDFNVVDGVDQSNIVLIAKTAVRQIHGTVHDNNGSPISAQLYASVILNGTNYSACGGNADPSGNFQIIVFDGNWQLGISGDLTSRGYDNPPNQNVHVSGANATANLVIYPLGQTPPALMQAGFFNGHFQFHVTGSPDQKYRIECTTNLQNPSGWTILRTNTAFGGSFDFADTNAISAPPRFYRAVHVQ